MIYGGEERGTIQLKRGDEPPIEVPELPSGVHGETVGDLAVIDDSAVEWNGEKWVPSAWLRA